MSDLQTADPTPIRLIVIGASAGGLEPLRSVVAALPEDFPAAVLVVMHISSTSRSLLPEILNRAGSLRARSGTDGMEIRPGTIVAATPDRHLVVDDGRLRLTRGPRENGHRPAVDTLFRSAAEHYGSACCGVILSGTQDDGATGLAAIKSCGGVAIVQDPEDAAYAGMPSNALAATNVDHVLPAPAIGPTLLRLARGEEARMGPVKAPSAPTVERLVEITCPECGGTLTERDTGNLVAFRCHVGHAFSAGSLVAAHAHEVERAMWAAARQLEDRTTLLRGMARRARARDNARSAARFDREADEALQQRDVIRGAIAALHDGGLTPADVEPDLEAEVGA